MQYFKKSRKAESVMQTAITLTLIAAIILTSFSGCIRTKEPGEQAEDYTGVELTYYKVFDDADVIEPFINEYLSTHPGLKIRYRKFSDFDEYQKTILDEMAEGEGPDIFSMQNTWFMDNYRKISPMPKDFGSPDDFGKIFVDTAYTDLVREDDDGKNQVYALPMTVDTLALYYNKDHFEDRLPTQGRPSETWEGIKNDVVQLNKGGVSGIAMGRADNITRGVDILYLLFLQYGVNFYNENISKATFAGQQGVGTFAYPGLEALKLYTSFADSDQKYYSWNEFIADDDSEAKEIETFAAGQVSMIIGYSYMYDQILDQIEILKATGQSHIDKSSIRIAPVPQLYDPDISTEKRVTYASYFAETVSKNTEHADIAWDFLIFLTERAQLEDYFDQTHQPTSRRDMISDQKQDPIYGVFAEQIGYAESFPIVEYYRYKEIFADVINKANDESVTTSDLTEAQDLITAMLPLEGLLPDIEVPEEEEGEAAEE